jgi:hypothetical protein
VPLKASFLISTVQDPLVNLPLVIHFYHIYLPGLIKHRVGVPAEDPGWSTIDDLS